MGARSGEIAPSAGEQSPGRPRLRRRGGRRIPGWVLLAVLVALGALGAFTTVSVLSVRADLIAARDALERGKSELLAGDASAARSSFVLARERFSAAQSWAGNPVLRVVGWLPLVGRTPDAVVGIAAAGTETAQAAVDIASAVADLPGGLAALAPANGAVPIERIAPIAEAVTRADTLTGQALQTIVDAPDTLLIGVGSARHEAETRLRELHDTIHAAAQILTGLPGFLGASGPQRYFFGAQNPAELRGTGGIMGAYSILTIDRGRFAFSPFRPIQSLPILPLDRVEPPNADYARNYDQFRGGRRFWTAINLMPDFPSVAQAILNGYRAVTGDRLDGVITADPFALQALLKITGPTEVPGYGVRITADTVIPFTTNEAYSLFRTPEQRKRVLGDVAESVFERFVSNAAPNLGALKTVARTAAAGHIQAFSTDPDMEEGLRASSVGGALRPANDFLQVVVNSAAGSKVDYYQQRSISYAVRLEPDNLARGTARVMLTNQAPTSGQPRYVIGPYQPTEADGRVGPVVRHLHAGESVALTSVYCGSTCVPQSATLDGHPTDAARRTDLGVPYAQAYFPITSGQTAELAVSWTVRDGWTGNSSGGTYRLTFVNQVTIRPTRLHVEIAPPPGMSVSSVSGGMHIQGGRAVYDGVPGIRLELDVSFRPPLLMRLWRDVLRFLRQPAIRF